MHDRRVRDEAAPLAPGRRRAVGRPSHEQGRHAVHRIRRERIEQTARRVERDVDCAFGLSALARPGTFHTKIMNAVMVDEETHEWVRWGKLTGGALGRGQTDAPAPMEV